MNYVVLSELLIKVLGIYFAINAFNYSIYLAGVVAVEGLSDWFVPEVARIGVNAFVAMLLILSASQISKLITPSKVADEEIKNSMGVQEWTGVGISLLGIYFVVSMISPLSNLLSTMNKVSSESVNGIPDGLIATLIGYCITVVIGLWLTMGGKGIANAISQLRVSGVQK